MGFPSGEIKKLGKIKSSLSRGSYYKLVADSDEQEKRIKKTYSSCPLERGSTGTGSASIDYIPKPPCNVAISLYWLHHVETVQYDSQRLGVPGLVSIIMPCLRLSDSHCAASL